MGEPRLAWAPGGPKRRKGPEDAACDSNLLLLRDDFGDAHVSNDGTGWAHVDWLDSKSPDCFYRRRDLEPAEPALLLSEEQRKKFETVVGEAEIKHGLADYKKKIENLVKDGLSQMQKYEMLQDEIHDFFRVRFSDNKYLMRVIEDVFDG